MFSEPCEFLLRLYCSTSGKKYDGIFNKNAAVKQHLILQCAQSLLTLIYQIVLKQQSASLMNFSLLSNLWGGFDLGTKRVHINFAYGHVYRMVT